MKTKPTKIFYTGIGSKPSGVHTVAELRKIISNPKWRKGLEDAPSVKASIQEWMNYIGAFWITKSEADRLIKIEKKKKPSQIHMTLDIVATLKKGTTIEDAIESMNVTMEGATVDIVDSSVAG